MSIIIHLSTEAPVVRPDLFSELAPHLFWALVLIVCLWFLGPRRIMNAILNARKLSFAGIEIELRGEIAEAAASKNILLTSYQQDQLTERVEQLRLVLARLRLLWIDDNPFNNAAEIRLLSRLGIVIDLAVDDNVARLLLERGVYDLVISDMARHGNPDAGRSFLPTVLDTIVKPEIIFYVGDIQDTPKEAFGLTTRPDQLLALILDFAERRR